MRDPDNFSFIICGGKPGTSDAEHVVHGTLMGSLGGPDTRLSLSLGLAGPPEDVLPAIQEESTHVSVAIYDWPLF